MSFYLLCSIIWRAHSAYRKMKICSLYWTPINTPWLGCAAEVHTQFSMCERKINCENTSSSHFNHVLTCNVPGNSSTKHSAPLLTQLLLTETHCCFFFSQLLTHISGQREFRETFLKTAHIINIAEKKEMLVPKLRTQALSYTFIHIHYYKVLSFSLLAVTVCMLTSLL